MKYLQFLESIAVGPQIPAISLSDISVGRQIPDTDRKISLLNIAEEILEIPHRAPLITKNEIDKISEALPKLINNREHFENILLYALRLDSTMSRQFINKLIEIDDDIPKELKKSKIFDTWYKHAHQKRSAIL